MDIFVVIHAYELEVSKLLYHSRGILRETIKTLSETRGFVSRNVPRLLLEILKRLLIYPFVLHTIRIETAENWI